MFGNKFDFWFSEPTVFYLYFVNIIYIPRFEKIVLFGQKWNFSSKNRSIRAPNGPFWVQNVSREKWIFLSKKRTFFSLKSRTKCHLICQNWFDLNPYIVSGGAREQTTSIFKTLKVSFSDLILVWVAILVQRWAGLSKQEIMYKQAWENGKYKE